MEMCCSDIIQWICLEETCFWIDSSCCSVESVSHCMHACQGYIIPVPLIDHDWAQQGYWSWAIPVQVIPSEQGATPTGNIYFWDLLSPGPPETSIQFSIHVSHFTDSNAAIWFDALTVYLYFISPLSFPGRSGCTITSKDNLPWWAGGGNITFTQGSKEKHLWILWNSFGFLWYSLAQL